jgi:DNA-binding NarL/FixJ family response regulator
MTQAVPTAAKHCLGCSTTAPLPSIVVGPYIAIVVVVPAPSAELAVRESVLAVPLRTLVIDSQPLFLAALSTLLGAEPLSARVTTCARTDIGLDLARASNVDVVFCEVRAVPMSGSEFVSVLAQELPRVPVILLGDRNDESLLTEALTSPAAGFFTKEAGLDEFLVGVQAVLSGHRAIGASLMGRVLDRLKHQPAIESKRNGSQLSPTEVEILVMIGHAESIPAIAASRGISHKTVRNHLAKIYRKLELHGRTEAMLWAARSGLTSR